MGETVLAVLITGIASVACAVITQVAGLVSNRRLVSYEIEELTKRVDKHNNIIERTYRLEEKVAGIDERLDLMEKKL